MRDFMPLPQFQVIAEQHPMPVFRAPLGAQQANPPGHAHKPSHQHRPRKERHMSFAPITTLQQQVAKFRERLVDHSDVTEQPRDSRSAHGHKYVQSTELTSSPTILFCRFGLHFAYGRPRLPSRSGSSTRRLNSVKDHREGPINPCRNGSTRSAGGGHAPSYFK